MAAMLSELAQHVQVHPAQREWLAPIAGGLATPPDTPGVGISWDWDAIDGQRIA